MFGWYKYCFAHYFTLSGRASRAEFWSFFFVNGFIQILIVLAGLTLGILLSTPTSEAEEAANAAPELSVFVLFLAVAAIYYCISILPSIAVTVRRLHDRDLSGWWVVGGILLSFFVVGGLIAFFILICMFLGSIPAPNQYGIRAPQNPRDKVPDLYSMQAERWKAYNIQKDYNGLGQIGPNGYVQPPNAPGIQNNQIPLSTSTEQDVAMSTTSDNSTPDKGTKSLLEEMRSGQLDKAGNQDSKPVIAPRSSTHRPTTPQESSLVSSLKQRQGTPKPGKD